MGHIINSWMCNKHFTLIFSALQVTNPLSILLSLLTFQQSMFKEVRSVCYLNLFEIQVELKRLTFNHETLLLHTTGLLDVKWTAQGLHVRTSQQMVIYREKSFKDMSGIEMSPECSWKSDVSIYITAWE